MLKGESDQTIQQCEESRIALLDNIVVEVVQRVTAGKDLLVVDIYYYYGDQKFLDALKLFVQSAFHLYQIAHNHSGLLYNR